MQNDNSICSVIQALPCSTAHIDMEFRRYPQEFYIAESVSAVDFFNRQFPRDHSKRLRLCLRLSIARRWSCAKVADDIQAFRNHNASLLVWRAKEFVKVALSNDAQLRIEEARTALQRPQLTERSWVPEIEFFKIGESLAYRMPLVFPIPLDQSALARLDMDLKNLYVEFKSGGISHGDFHINNCGRTENGQLIILDWDQAFLGGADLDMIGFFVHFLGFYVFKDYFNTLSLLRDNPDLFCTRTRESGFPLCAGILRPLLNQRHVLKRFIEQRIDWGQRNQAADDYIDRLKMELGR